MQPLGMTDPGERGIIRQIAWAGAMRRYLAQLGFTPGTPVTVIGGQDDSLMVDAGHGRIALDRLTAMGIMIAAFGRLV